MNCLITHMFAGLEHEKKIYKDQEPQRKEMLSLYCTVLGFISKKKEYNPEEIIPTYCIWKTWYYKKLLRKENN